MERVAVDGLNSSDGANTSNAGVDRLTDLLGTTDLAINRYRIPPDGRLPAGLHAHMDQEEVFVVLSGTATFETLDGELTVSAGEAIRFAPGDFQAGRNAGSEPLELLALGAPRRSEDVRIPIDCSTCGHADLRLDFGDEALTFVCPDCGTEREPTDCPACSGEDLRVVLGDAGDPIVTCENCDATFERPPVRGEW